MSEPRRSAAAKAGPGRSGDVRPSPDPTLLTTDAVNDAVLQAKDYTDMSMAVFAERLNGIDRATEVLHETVTRVPTETQLAIGHLSALTNEKFAGIDRVLDEQRRAIDVAEEEREKSAKALRVELGRQIADGDKALHDHVTAQIAQVEAGLRSADMLEKERILRIAERIDAEKRIQELTRELGDTAILKAEAAADKRFDEFSKKQDGQMTAILAAMQDLTARLDRSIS